MSMTLRGCGSDKTPLVVGLVKKFGEQEFLMREAKDLSEFTLSDFIKLSQDKVVQVVKKTAPCTWRVSESWVSRYKNVGESVV
jgi:acyl carrier protein phosphodiesterase